MIRFFHVNNAGVIPFLFLFAVIMHLSLFIVPVDQTLMDVREPFSRFFFQLCGWLFQNNYYGLAAISVILVFLQALMINAIVNRIKLFNSGTFVPALVYVTAACLFRDFMLVSPALLSLLFVIPVISKIMQLYRNQSVFTQVFDSGLLIALAALFYRPAVVLMLLLIIALLSMRAFNWREWLIGLMGFLTPFFLVATLFFLTGDLDLFLFQYIAGNVFEGHNLILPVSFASIPGVYTLLLLLAAVITFFTHFLKSPIQVRKFISIILWAALLLAAGILLSERPALQHFVLLAVPLSVMLSYFLLNLRRKLIADVLHLLWVVIVVIFHFV
ncbi:MAG: hypothetical protein KatS3mg031_1882 [Chitinophagales bacterium]|nr:MAG: hypothetical protein KatS3mg031_1882 [Chitinophagales bacterium]